MEKLSRKGEKWSAEDEDNLDPKMSFLQYWTKTFLASCLVAILLDPLFLYIPIIDRNMNCLGVDRNLKITTLILRSGTDLLYLMDIAVQVYTCDDCSGLLERFRNRRYFKFQFLWKSCLPTIAKTIWRSYILIDILAILPLPQVAILVFFPKMRSSTSLNVRKVIMNFSVLIQYVPRVLRIYLSCKELRYYTANKETGVTAIWVKGVLNFFMYILSSHVLGAVWYFFAIQRMLVCWQYNCRNQNACDTAGTFACHHQRTSRNITFLNELCSTSPLDTMPFDFGIFLSVLQSGIPESTSFIHKFLNCFCWGLQNLSALGSNLRPSTNAWENLFVAFISIIGLLLFIYLIGNLQTYMQLDTARIEEHRHKLKMKRKVEEKDREVEWWLTKNGIPEKSKNDIKLQIIRTVELELEEKRDAGIDRILFILPRDLHSYIKSCMPFTKLKQVPVLQNKDEEVVQAICDHLKPMTYPDETVIFREGEPIDKMLLIVDGTVLTEKRGSDDLQGSERELCGENLLDWPSLISFPDKLPLATKSAKAVGDVEALVLTSIDMQSIGFRFSYQFGKYDKVKKQLDNNLAKASYDQFKEQLANYKSSYAFEGQLANDYKLFTPEELMKATYNYHASQLVGEGHNGRVYKGNLTNGSMVVIKKTPKFSSPDQSEQYVREVITYSHIHHRHMVRFLGYCVETEQPLMVFEFVNNGTLYEHIHGMMRNSLLPLMLRLKIAAGIATALEYMHNCANFPIIHGDVQTINIHLDEKYTAKLSDCLSSPLVPEDENQLSTLVEWTSDI